MTLANKQYSLLIQQVGCTVNSARYLRDAAGASGEANPRYPGHHATQRNSFMRQWR